MKAVRIPSPSTASSASRAVHGHSHSAGLLQEHDHEPVLGLPEELPIGERIIWQGAPRWQAMAVEAFHLRKLTLYFAVLMALRLSFVIEEITEPLPLFKAMAPFIVLALSALLALWAVAWLSARHTLYTITNKRVVMRIGIVLTVTFNIPFSRIVAAHLKTTHRDHGDVALEIVSDNRIPWLQLWPHARAWHLRNPQPVLRGVAAAPEVAALLTQAWSESRGVRAHAARESVTSPVTSGWSPATR